MTVWLSKPVVMAIHDRQLAEHGGSTGLRNEPLLEAALARPPQLHAYGQPAPDLCALAASLAYGLARDPPFVDGNKRTAAVACETFIELNEARLTAEDAKLFPRFLALAEGALSESAFADWLREHVLPSSPNEIQETPVISPQK